MKLGSVRATLLAALGGALLAPPAAQAAYTFDVVPGVHNVLELRQSPEGRDVALTRLAPGPKSVLRSGGDTRLVVKPRDPASSVPTLVTLRLVVPPLVTTINVNTTGGSWMAGATATGSYRIHADRRATIPAFAGLKAARADRVFPRGTEWRFRRPSGISIAGPYDDSLMRTSPLARLFSAKPRPRLGGPSVKGDWVADVPCIPRDESNGTQLGAFSLVYFLLDVPNGKEGRLNRVLPFDQDRDCARVGFQTFQDVRVVRIRGDGRLVKEVRDLRAPTTVRGRPYMKPPPESSHRVELFFDVRR